MLNPIKVARPTSAVWPAQLTVSALNRLGQYASSLGPASAVMQNSPFLSW